jgi:heme a synthase
MDSLLERSRGLRAFLESARRTSRDCSSRFRLTASHLGLEVGKIVALMSDAPSLPIAPHALPFRLAKGALGATMVLLLFGGLVTTIGAGMAVAGWIDAEGHFLPLFPFAKWFRDIPTFAEHTHRMLGVLVGLLLIAMVIATFAKDRRISARLVAIGALLAVIAQGIIGGTRVLENSQGLAFLHGAVGQAVFAILWCTTLFLMPSYQSGGRTTAEASRRITSVGMVATAIIYGQILLGAWFRHSIRHATTMPSTGESIFPMAAFIAHGMGAIVVVGAVLVLAKSVRTGWEDSEDETVRKILRRQELWLHICFGMQLILGLGSLSTLGMERTAIPVVIITTLHVLFGALLLSAAAGSSLWGRRLEAAPTNSTSAELS